VEPSSPLEAVWNSSMESPIMAHSGDGGSLLVEPMKVAAELLFLERSSGLQSSWR
jgi:hypothetical protein